MRPTDLEQTVKADGVESSSLQRLVLPIAALIGVGIGSVTWLRSGEKGLDPQQTAAPKSTDQELPPADLATVLGTGDEISRTSVGTGEVTENTPNPTVTLEESISSLEIFDRYVALLHSKVADSPEQIVFLRARTFQYHSLLSFDEVESLKEVLAPDELAKHQFDGLLSGMYRRLIEYSREQDQEGALFERLVQSYRTERIEDGGDETLASFFARLINLHIAQGSLTREEIQPLDSLMIESAQRGNINNGWLLPGLLAADRQFPGVIASIHDPKDLALFVKDNHFSLQPSSFNYYVSWTQHGGTPQDWFDQVGAEAIRSGFKKTPEGYQTPLSQEQFQQKLDFIAVLPLIVQSGEISGESIVKAFPPELFSKFNYSFTDEQGNLRGARIDLSVPMAQFIGAYGGEAGARYLEKLAGKPDISDALRFECRSSRVFNGRMPASELAEAIEGEEDPNQIAEFLLAQAQYDQAAREALGKIISNPQLDINLRTQALLLAGEFNTCEQTVERALQDREATVRYCALLAYCHSGITNPEILERFVLHDSLESHFLAALTLARSGTEAALKKLSSLTERAEIAPAIRENLQLLIVDPKSTPELFLTNWREQLESNKKRLEALDSSAQLAVLRAEKAALKSVEH